MKKIIGVIFGETRELDPVDREVPWTDYLDRICEATVGVEAQLEICKRICKNGGQGEHFEGKREN